MSLTPKNWKSFQHYKDRAPAWIKLHRGLLDDYDFHRLPVASRALAPLLWLLASEYEEGAITASIEELAFRLRMSENEMRSALTPLISSGFFNASDVLAECKQDACLEKEEEKEEEREEEKREISARKRGARLSEDWKPSTEDWVQAIDRLGSVIASENELAKFRDYWRAQPGQRGVKLDWDATWRNWIRNARGRSPPIAKPLTEFQRKQQETNDVREMLRNSAAAARGGGTADRVLSDNPGERPGDLRGGAGSTILALPRASGSGSG